ncbi:M48 family metalloprotease [Paraburkholderia sp.]|uniref:M48 family metalloprotease n=1 Tax=Paraburkholderia sp. TaxID=1926495 RepID=UPI00397D320C
MSAPLLEPLAYHRAIVAFLRENEPEIWNWSASQRTHEEHVQETRSQLLRETYRLDAEAHPELHEDCRLVLNTLGLDAPVTLYQAADSSMNAALSYIPGEIHLIFYGPVLEKLSKAERIALLGHELAHYKLWSINDGAYHVATRILDHSLAYQGCAPSHNETARAYRLYTELYADRGAAQAAGSPRPAIATLVKTMTGLSVADPDAYLRQAAELESEAGKSYGETHPEVFLRVQALHKWWQQDTGVESWIDARIRGPLSLNALDLPRQHELTALTRGFLARLAADPAAVGEAVPAQLRRYFPDWRVDELPFDNAALAPDRIDDSVRDYLIALSFDLAMADPDARDALLTAGAHLAQGFGGLNAYRVALKRDLKLGKQAIERLLAPLGEGA